MHKLTEYPISKARAKKLASALMLIFCLAPVIINSAILSPLYTVMNANVAVPTWVLIAIDYLMDILDVIAFSVPYALIIFAALLLGKKTARYIVVLYSVFFFLQIPVKILMNIPVNGSIGSSEQIITDFIYLSVYFLLFMFQMTIVYLFAATDTKKYMRHLDLIKAKNEKKKKSKVNVSEEVAAEFVFPFTNFYSYVNPLQRSALKMGILISAVKIFARILNDVSYGLPTSAGEVLVMVIYYLSDVIYGIAAYVIAIMMFNFVYEKTLNKKADEAEASSEYDVLN